MKKRFLIQKIGLLGAIFLSATFAPLVYAQETIPDASGTQADTVAPSDVENLKAEPGNGFVNLSWNVATDNVGIQGYKLYYGTTSVKKEGDAYENGPIDIGNKISHKVENLTNGTTYYFALTAVDAAGNESESYSLEASATPSHNAADKEAPKVAKAEAVDKTHVRVTFSEAVRLPSSSPEGAFSIKNDLTSAILEVKEAKIDTSDTTNKSVLLTTADQQAATSYILTAGIEIQDEAGNPIVSGTSDTAHFTGSDKTEVAQAQTQTNATDDKESPAFKSAEALDPTHVEIVFSEPVTLKADGRENFIVTEEENFENTLEITKVELSETKTRVTLTTSPQKALTYTIIAVDVADNAGNVIKTDNTFTFTGKAEGTTPAPTDTQSFGEDKTAPEDATNFLAKILKKLVATLTWTASPNTAGDLDSYVLYKSTDGENYDTGTKVDGTATSHDVGDLLPQTKYYFKLTAKDKAGNESEGVFTTFTLPETGPALALVLLGSVAAGRILKKKK